MPADMTDAELLELQFGKERRLRLLSEAEASDRLERAGKPRMCIERSDEATSDETCRRPTMSRPGNGQAALRGWTTR